MSNHRKAFTPAARMPGAVNKSKEARAICNFKNVLQAILCRPIDAEDLADYQKCAMLLDEAIMARRAQRNIV